MPIRLARLTGRRMNAALALGGAIGVLCSIAVFGMISQPAYCLGWVAAGVLYILCVRGALPSLAFLALPYTVHPVHSRLFAIPGIAVYRTSCPFTAPCHPWHRRIPYILYIKKGKAWRHFPFFNAAKYELGGEGFFCLGDNCGKSRFVVDG